jgi:ADP-ribosylglycohydrolase
MGEGDASLCVSAIEALLEAFAVGDAFGMPTEFMTRGEIVSSLAGPSGLVEAFVEPERSRNHSNLARAQITDDTEQNLYLMKAFLAEDRIDGDVTARALLSWIRETGAVEKRYIGPSSFAALTAIENGGDIESAGMDGRTCGGLMRAPAATLTALSRGWDLEASVRASCLPTHNTETALEAAMAYAFALRAALASSRPDGAASAPAAADSQAIAAVTEEAMAGARAGRAVAPYAMCAASTEARVGYLRGFVSRVASAGELLDFLFGVFGTGLESADVAAAAMGIFMYAKTDVWLAIRMGASAGGDTDTIAALAGGLCAALGGTHNIPPAVLDEVKAVNHLRLGPLSAALAARK